MSPVLLHIASCIGLTPSPPAATHQALELKGIRQCERLRVRLGWHSRHVNRHRQRPRGHAPQPLCARLLCCQACCQLVLVVRATCLCLQPEGLRLREATRLPAC
jgi:hypothetical protein